LLPEQLRLLKWHFAFLGLVTDFSSCVLVDGRPLPPGTSNDYRWSTAVNAFGEARWEFHHVLETSDTFWCDSSPRMWGYIKDHRTIVGSGFFRLIPEARDEWLDRLLEAVYQRMVTYLDVAEVPMHTRGLFGIPTA
jgi:hypothetical protein